MKMKKLQNGTWIIGMLGVVAAVSWVVLFSGPRVIEPKHASRGPKLIAIHPLPEM